MFSRVFVVGCAPFLSLRVCVRVSAVSVTFLSVCTILCFYLVSLACLSHVRGF